MHLIMAKYDDGPMRLSNHYHDCHQLLYVAGGEIEAVVGAERYCVRAGELFILSRFEEHAIMATKGDYRRYVLQISPDGAQNSEEIALLSSVLINRSAQFCRVVPLGEHTKAFEARLSAMAEEYRKQAPLCREMLDLSLSALLIELYRIRPTLFWTEGGRNAELVRRLQRRMEEDCGAEYSLAALAAEYHISSSHLAHSFKEITGYAPIDYLIHCRISTAKRALATTDRPICEIVELCGFGDDSNFCRKFKQITGVTPGAFRNRYRHTHATLSDV